MLPRAVPVATPLSRRFLAHTSTVHTSMNSSWMVSHDTSAAHDAWPQRPNRGPTSKNTTATAALSPVTATRAMSFPVHADELPPAARPALFPAATVSAFGSRWQVSHNQARLRDTMQDIIGDLHVAVRQCHHTSTATANAAKPEQMARPAGSHRGVRAGESRRGLAT